jgi:hypothetical protein
MHDPKDSEGTHMTTTDGATSRQRRERDVAVNISTRLSLPVRDLLDDAVDREGISIREAIEVAIREKWGSAA